MRYTRLLSNKLQFLLVILIGCSPQEGTGKPEQDQDEDGYSSSADCDDTNADIRPGAIEVCDLRDNDCDDLIDEQAADAGTWYADSDGDGYGADPITACERQPHFRARARSATASIKTATERSTKGQSTPRPGTRIWTVTATGRERPNSDVRVSKARPRRPVTVMTRPGASTRAQRSCATAPIKTAMARLTKLRPTPLPGTRTWTVTDLAPVRPSYSVMGPTGWSR
jgi:Putative metal-binding motif